MVSICFVVMFLLINCLFLDLVNSFIPRFHQSYQNAYFNTEEFNHQCSEYNYCKYNHISNLMMVSVGPGNGGGSPSKGSKQGSFIISPRLDTFENEMLILDNFNQIQLGNQRKVRNFIN